jgi:hypothetical protein
VNSSVPGNFSTPPHDIRGSGGKFPLLHSFSVRLLFRDPQMSVTCIADCLDHSYISGDLDGSHSPRSLLLRCVSLDLYPWCCWERIYSVNLYLRCSLPSKLLGALSAYYLKSFVGYVPSLFRSGIVLPPPSASQRYLICVITFLTLVTLRAFQPFRIDEVSENPFNIVLSRFVTASGGITIILCSP